MRAVASAQENSQPDQAASVVPGAQASAHDGEGVESAEKRGFPVLSAILFLIACAAGGAGYAAYPHMLSH